MFIAFKPNKKEQYYYNSDVIDSIIIERDNGDGDDYAVSIWFKDRTHGSETQLLSEEERVEFVKQLKG